MNIEIERKFLVKNSTWKDSVTRSYSIIQGYFPTSDGSALRVRISDNGSYITIKLPKINGNECPEFEYDIPLQDATTLIDYCRPHIIDKVRHEVEWMGNLWEIDVFEDRLKGITVAEIELDSVSQDIVLPSWVGREVTDDIKYTNKYLAFNYIS
jgi:adenylate cyclase